MNKKGVSLVELFVVVGISSMILALVFTLMNRTTLNFKKGSDMLNVQTLLDNIIERMRTDIRALKKLTKCTPDECEFIVYKTDSTTLNGHIKSTINYKFENNTLHRAEKNSKESFTTNFKAEGKVKFANFSENKDNNGNFESLSLIIRLISDENGPGKDSTLSIACAFYSACLDNNL